MIADRPADSVAAVFEDPLTRPVAGAVRAFRGVNGQTLPPFFSRADLTDARFAEQFASDQRELLRYDHRRRMWMVYEPPLWRPDSTGEVKRRLIDFARRQQTASIQSGLDPEARREVLTFLLRMEQRRGLENAEILSRIQAPCVCDGNEWDTQPHLLGTPQGILNLYCDAAPPVNDSALYVSKSIGCAYSPDARCVRWATFLDEIFLGNLAVIEWVQKAIGYSLSGDTREQVLFLLHGGGANGKSIFLETLAFMLGSYALNVPFSLFEERGRSTISNDMAALVGRRFVTASETTDRVRLNEARIKMLTGQDTVTARHLYAEYFSFRPVAKFWLSTNHLPVVRDRSRGFWRRVRMLPFLATFDGAARDGRLAETLRTEAPGILLWAMAGCTRWRREGLGDVPETIAAATQQFEADTDPLAGFIEDRCVIDERAQAGAGSMLAAYGAWADLNHLAPADRLTRNQFLAHMTARFEKRATNTGKAFRGIGFRVTE